MLVGSKFYYRGFQIHIAPGLTYPAQPITGSRPDIVMERLIHAMRTSPLTLPLGGIPGRAHIRDAIHNYRRYRRGTNESYRLIVTHPSQKEPIYSNSFTARRPSPTTIRRVYNESVRVLKERRASWKAYNPYSLNDKKPGTVLEKYRKRLAQMVFEHKNPATPERHYTVEIECYANITIEQMGLLMFDAGLAKNVTVKSDASLSVPVEDYPHGIEIVVCAPAQEFQGILQRVTDILALRAVVNKTCGLHVHLDFRDNRAGATKAFRNLVTSQKYLASMLPESRKSNRYCQLNRSADLSASMTDRYRFVNGVAFRKYQTIEVRGHSGTIDFKKIAYWVSICAAIAYSPQETKRALRSVDSLAKRYRLPTTLASYIKERQSLFAPRSSAPLELSETG